MEHIEWLQVIPQNRPGRGRRRNGKTASMNNRGNLFISLSAGDWIDGGGLVEAFYHHLHNQIKLLVITDKSDERKGFKLSLADGTGFRIYLRTMVLQRPGLAGKYKFEEIEEDGRRGLLFTQTDK